MGLRICMISDHGDPMATLGDVKSGGQNQYVYQLAVHLGRLGHDVDVYTHWSWAEAPEMEVFGERARVIRVSAGRRGNIGKEDLYHRLDRFYTEMTAKIAVFGPYDLVHAHYWMSGTLGRVLRREYGYPLVYTPHSLGVVKGLQTGRWDWERLWKERTVLVEADHVVVTTETERDLAKEFCGKTPTAEISVISAGVAEHFFRDTGSPETGRDVPVGMGLPGGAPLQSDAPWADRRASTDCFGDGRPGEGCSAIRGTDRDCGGPGEPSEQPRPFVLYIGRLAPEKGLGVLVDAYIMWAARNPDVPDLWIGGGDAAGREWRRWMERHTGLRRLLTDAPDRLRYLGPVANERLPDLYRAAAMVAVPSWYESFGLVAAEAMAAGGVVVASDIGGLRHIVRDGVTGRLVRPRDPEALARALGEIWRRKDLRERFRRKGTTDAKRRFFWPNIVRQMVEVYMAHAKQPVTLR
ncbi:MAG: glycosyltransferase [Kyrpidia sp.]|nr:glycosyltransferase [Kyrpidia sp.]